VRGARLLARRRGRNGDMSRNGRGLSWWRGCGRVGGEHGDEGTAQLRDIARLDAHGVLGRQALAIPGAAVATAYVHYVPVQRLWWLILPRTMAPLGPIWQTPTHGRCAAYGVGCRKGLG